MEDVYEGCSGIQQVTYDLILEFNKVFWKLHIGATWFECSSGFCFGTLHCIVQHKSTLQIFIFLTVKKMLLMT